MTARGDVRGRMEEIMKRKSMNVYRSKGFSATRSGTTLRATGNKVTVRFADEKPIIILHSWKPEGGWEAYAKKNRPFNPSIETLVINSPVIHTYYFMRDGETAKSFMDRAYDESGHMYKMVRLFPHGHVEVVETFIYEDHPVMKDTPHNRDLNGKTAKKGVEDEIKGGRFVLVQAAAASK
jgi:hypothetical protein